MFATFASPVPRAFFEQDMQTRWQQWVTAAQSDGLNDNAPLRAWMLATADNGHAAHDLISAIFGHSPYLSRLLLMEPAIAFDMTLNGADAAYLMLCTELAEGAAGLDQAGLMRHLRVHKGRLALLSALADVSGSWSLGQVTQALSSFAESAINLAVNFILLRGAKLGEITLPQVDNPSQDCGIIVLGMGKLGGMELNYSSDIDLILFYEAGRLAYAGRHTEQHFMNKLAHDLVSILQERTAQGYVFRTDLRLRPDPASTPPAVATEAAYYYYESVGQNWERAAMIKARPVGGDYAAGEQFIKNITPFMWRKSLDFASINDIHSIKRQMDTIHRASITVPGHNIKLGMGGIREIEFFVQIHQLIWGGREPVLRTRATCETLGRLKEYGLIEPATESLLIEAYGFYRMIEHRLQMVADEQTHSLPESEQGIAHIASFMGFSDTEHFRSTLLNYLTSVHTIYASSFKGVGASDARELGSAGNLVFTGTQHDPDTLRTLRAMGYQEPERISDVVMGWHHGSRRATRTKRAREILTELMPVLLKRLSETVNPDSAFMHFDAFLAQLPSGVQLFSLFHANPQLLGLISDIMGSAPALADHLSKMPDLLDAVLYSDFYEALPAAEALRSQLRNQLVATALHYEDTLESICRFRNERQFQAGVQLLKGMVDARQAGIFLSTLAEVCVQAMLDAVTEEFARTYGRIRGARFAVLALGRLGSCEMAFGSDIDLVFIYDVDDFDTLSDGEKPYTASVYYNRLAQRFITALAAVGREGRLYEVDTRLRPSGKQGLLAVSLKAFLHYFDDLAWTFEHMALVKGRAVAGDALLCRQINEARASILVKPRDIPQISLDVRHMRDRIAQEHSTHNPWDLKHVRGGLMDIDFIAQGLLLAHAHAFTAMPAGDTPSVLRGLAAAHKLDATSAEALLAAYEFFHSIFNILRLCSSPPYEMSRASAPLQNILATRLGHTDFRELEARLIQVEQVVQAQYSALLTVIS